MAAEAGTDGSGGGGDRRWLEWLGARVEGRGWPVVVTAEAGLAVAGRGSLGCGCGWLRPAVAWLWQAAVGCGLAVAGPGRLWRGCGWPWPAGACVQRAFRQDGGAPLRRRCWSGTTLVVGSRGCLVLAGGVVVASQAVSGFSWLRRRGCSGLLS
jgi:hypothetical protein